MSLPTPPSSPALSSASEDFGLLIEEELAAVASITDDEEDAAEEEEDSEGDDEEDDPAPAVAAEMDEEDEENSRSKRVKLDSAAGLSCPPHPGFMWGVCIRCGQLKPESQIVENVALKYIHEDFELAGDELDRLRAEELQQVLGERKLFLILDLDHTMLNSARFIELAEEEASYLQKTYLDENQPCSTVPDGAIAMAGGIQAGWGGLYKLHGLHLWTKLRPFAHKFLEEASKLFELYVYTMGERTYALTMAHLLDPTGKHFKGRVISQRDSTRKQIKDLDIVLGAESAVLILDDTERVWPKHRANLIVMERYHFFTSSCKQFCLHNPSLTEALRDEAESEGALANVLGVLKRIHSDFFEERDKQRNNDVRDVTSCIRSEILAGCNVVFSHIFPSQYAEPELHPLWILCVELGAQCTMTVEESVTHVIALNRGTDKARWAKQHGKFLVHPSWVEAAHSLWRRPEEGDYPVRDGQVRAPVLTFAATMDVEMIKTQERTAAAASAGEDSSAILTLV